jgi:BlaI family transcriptional regulator, penicillinase repressor
MIKLLHGLGSLQSEVMDLVWAEGEATVAQLYETIGARRRITYTTILSAVQKLERKSWLKHRTAGRAYVYYPVRDRLEVGGRTLRDLLRTAFEGDPRLLLASLLDETNLSDEDLKELRKLIEQRRKEIRS